MFVVRLALAVLALISSQLAPASAPSAPTAAAVVPPVSARAHAAGLVDVRTAVPDAIIDLRYATAHNFTGVRLYPTDARCLVHRTMTHGLRIAANRLRRKGLRLVFWDCYRPHSVQVRMYKIVPNPAWVAKPGPYAYSHEAGRSVDVTLAHAAVGGCASHRVHGHCLLPMGTGFDNFTPRAYAYATAGVSPRAEGDRRLLRHAMAAGGLSVYSGEWWHFDGPGADVHRPILHAPLR
ncbi:MAG TPA: M15 family metallopeptidase [Jatrophihabitantaceae bacterium]|jgi:D-alanyl-D-alanine dipeptidase|nr:M15 family metallopeptidase [Jatrophihabitantaceae bacterium]